MKITLETEIGIQVRVQPAHLQFATPMVDGKPAAMDLGPVLHVCDDLLDFMGLAGSVPTRSGVIEMKSADAMGVVYAKGTCSTAVMLFDLGDSIIKNWLKCSHSLGYLPVQFKSGSRAQLAHLPMDEGLQRIIERSRKCEPASSETLISAMQFIVGQFDSRQELARLGLESGTQSLADVSLVVTADSGNSMLMH